MIQNLVYLFTIFKNILQFTLFIEILNGKFFNLFQLMFVERVENGVEFRAFPGSVRAFSIC